MSSKLKENPRRKFMMNMKDLHNEIMILLEFYFYSLLFYAVCLDKYFFESMRSYGWMRKVNIFGGINIIFGLA